MQLILHNVDQCRKPFPRQAIFIDLYKQWPLLAVVYITQSDNNFTQCWTTIYKFLCPVLKCQT